MAKRGHYSFCQTVSKGILQYEAFLYSTLTGWCIYNNHRNTDHEYAMGVFLDPDQVSTESYLWTPVVDISEEMGCLLLHTLLFVGPLDKTIEPTVYPYVEFSVGISSGEEYNSIIYSELYYTPNEWIETALSLPPGKYELLFKVNFIIRMSILDDSYLAFWLANVTLESDCLQTESATTQSPQTSQPINQTETIAHTNETTDTGNSSAPTSNPLEVTTIFYPDPQFDGYLGKDYDSYEYLLSKWNGCTPDDTWVNMKDVSANLSHKMADIIQSCKWNGFEGTCNPIEEVDTNAGHCFMFNGNETNVIKTMRTGANKLHLHLLVVKHSIYKGSEFGLRLVLNIESYQYVSIFNQYDAGIKVLLKSQNDASSVEELGFGVSPGDHVLASVTYTEVGKEINKNSAVASYYGNIYVEREKCETDCPDACTTIVQPVSLSNTQMQGNSFLDSLPQGYKDKVLRQFKETEFARSRVDPSIFEETTREVIMPMESFTKAHNFIQTKIRNKMTSTIQRIINGINYFLNLARNDITLRIFKDFQNHVKFYDNSTKIYVDPINSRGQAALYSLAELIMYADLWIAYSSNSLTAPVAYPSLDEEFFTVLTSEIGNDLYMFGNTYYFTDLKFDKEREAEVDEEINSEVDKVNPRILGIDELSLDPTLLKECASGNGYNDFEQLSRIVSDIQTGGKTLDFYKSEIVKYGTAYSLFLRKVLECTTEYGIFLNTVQSFLTQIDNTVLQLSDDVFGDFFDQLYSETVSFLDQNLRKFMANQQTKGDLAEEIESLNVADIMNNVYAIVNSYSSDVSTALKTNILSTRSSVIALYIQAMEHARTLSAYTDHEIFRDDARSARIWRVPFLNIETPEIISYRYAASELMYVWPTTQNINSFLDSGGLDKMTSTVNTYFDDLVDVLNDLDKELDNLISQLNTDLLEMESYFEEYRSTLVIDETFVSQSCCRQLLDDLRQFVNCLSHVGHVGLQKFNF
ncbi:hypothetical protein CAPTEDRAFT_189093 [Capitella teleta]|uniref:Uncharacterized protein n=1 Tax=Capitella teleta TaxID=283909 RepID=R7T3R4_CAPTE|nr:hypothetical protein CAPTEDRAFT_189093 [Capitella teleta]|eukprot:ELT87301.1 hypothetical protein CAPTEDRAFT_189093 [Capitella teleta]